MTTFNLQLFKGLDTSKTKTQTFVLTLDDNRIFSFDVDIPLKGEVNHQYGTKSKFKFSLLDEENFEKAPDACLPFPRIEFYHHRYPLTLSGDIKNIDSQNKPHISIKLAVLDCTGFEPLSDFRHFNAAVDRNIYTRWGPGAFEYDFTTGHDRQLKQFNNIDWISFGSRRQGGKFYDKQSFSFIQSCYALIDERYMFEVIFQIGRSLDTRLHATALEYVKSVSKPIIASIFTRRSGDGWKKFNESFIDNKKYYEQKTTVPMTWSEKPLIFLDEFHLIEPLEYDDYDEQPDSENESIESPYEDQIIMVDSNLFCDEVTYFHKENLDSCLSKSLIFSPYKPEDANKKIDPPLDQLADNALHEKFLEMYWKLVGQMKKTYASHLDYDKDRD